MQKSLVSLPMTPSPLVNGFSPGCVFIYNEGTEVFKYVTCTFLSDEVCIFFSGKKIGYGMFLAEG